MSTRPLIIATLVGASVGVPYFSSQSKNGQNTAGGVQSAPTGASAQPALTTSALPSNRALPSAVALGRAVPAPKLDGSQFTSVAQVFRFDVTKEWIYRNWSRKTTGPTDVGLFSVRVPLVMGTQVSALAGSLTYYFNTQGQVEHISFRGRTGDTTGLVQLLTTYYKFQQVQGPIGEHVYVVGSSDGIQSELRTRPEAIVRSNAPQQSIVVELELARPGSQRFLPPRGPALQIPQVALPPAAQTTPASGNVASESMSSKIKAAASNYWDQVHYATPAEQGPLLQNRWPD